MIDYTEFITAAADKTKMLSEKNLKFVFNTMDKDGNGQITKAELKQMFETSEEKDEKLWQSIFEEVDLDNDGLITYEEFATHMRMVTERNAKDSYIVNGQLDEQKLLLEIGE
mmetsp:Transcript_25062/g.38899  ORF Transcript_25062/g.38899 Transcript_25062/m.38899 type:complete len:112 (+) Transcript_25062:1160-1495(+)